MDFTRRLKKGIFALTVPALIIATLVGCGGSGFDSKTTIYVEPFSGSGFGYKWLERRAAEWSEQTNSSFKIVVDTSSVYMASRQLEQIASGVSKTDIFFGAEPDYKEGIYKGYFEDLSDMLDVKPDGASGKTIREKITNWDTWKKVAAKNTYNAETDEFGFQGFYMLPYSVTISGLIFDYDAFEEKGLITYETVSNETKAALEAQGISYEIDGKNFVFKSSSNPTNYEDGDYIAIPGNDGKYGTYDDGQPQTIADFEKLINMICAKNGKPFIYSKEGLYLDSTIYAALTQMSGLDAYDALSTFDSNGKEVEMYDGSKEVITWENGYKTYNVKNLDTAVNFFETNFFKTKSYFTKANYVSGAQDPFINSIIGNGDFYGFINEGNWFENEASETFKAAHRKGGKEYGKYDLRFLMMPDFDGQAGLDGEGNGACISAPEYGAITVRKQEDPEKLSAIKSFLSYVLKNDSLAKTNVETGMIWGYDYTISNDLTSEMTLFEKTCYDIYHDTENVRVLCHRTDKLACPFTYAAKDILSTTTILPVGNSGSTIAGALQNGMTGAEIVRSIRSNYTASAWAEILKQIKTQIS